MSTAVRIWEDNFKILMKIRSKSERNALLFALVSYGFCGEIPQDLKLNENNLLLFEVLKNNFIAKNQGGAPVGNFNRCSTVEKKENNQNQPLSENRKQKTENINNNIPSNEGGKTEKINFAISQINEVFSKFGLPKILKLTEQRRTKLKQRIREVGGFNNFLGEMEKALAESSFLRGDNSRSWSADFDFFLQASSWQKALEGKYADRQRKDDDADYWAELEKRVAEAENA